MTIYASTLKWVDKERPEGKTFEMLLDYLINMFQDKFGETPDLIECSKENKDIPSFFHKGILVITKEELKKEDITLYKKAE